MVLKGLKETFILRFAVTISQTVCLMEMSPIRLFCFMVFCVKTCWNA